VKEEKGFLCRVVKQVTSSGTVQAYLEKHKICVPKVTPLGYCLGLLVEKHD